jgi:predicted protein tyrosine phosphatase
VPRCIIRADDCYPSSASRTALTELQANRIARFARDRAGDISTLLVTCRHGEGRSASVALVTASVYDLDWEHFVGPPFAPNGWIIDLLGTAFTELGMPVPSKLASADASYDRERERGTLQNTIKRI